MVGRRNAGWTTSEWTSLPMPKPLARAFCRKVWKRISTESSLMSPNDTVGQGTELNYVNKPSFDHLAWLKTPGPRRDAATQA